MRAAALTTMLAITICTGVAVLLPIDLAVLARERARARSLGEGADSGDDADSGGGGGGGGLPGLGGIDQKTLSLIWAPLYWLSSILGLCFTFVLYYNQSGFLTHRARLRATLSRLVWMKVYFACAAVVIILLLVYHQALPAFSDVDSWLLYTDMLKVVLVTTYMTLQPLI